MASFHRCQDTCCNCTEAFTNPAFICEHTASNLVALQVSKMAPRKLTRSQKVFIWTFLLHSSIFFFQSVTPLAESIVPPVYMFCIVSGIIQQWKKRNLPPFIHSRRLSASILHNLHYSLQGRPIDSFLSSDSGPGGGGVAWEFVFYIKGSQGTDPPV